ncbi:MAG: YmdB family metallophosphoesterase [Puniceicoccales bacterium]|jgi:metallophosphoesterase (TIGR00282 family)|nr:YmdB family metallophosphoesterase [Puniceicoccales bacterium]
MVQAFLLKEMSFLDKFSFSVPYAADKMQESLRILYLGDIVGRPARKFLGERLPHIREVNNIDLVIANGENATSGAGINLKSIRELKAARVDVITLGDHVLDRDFCTEADEVRDLGKICIPCNLESKINCPKFVTCEIGGIKVGICIVLGRQFMKLHVSCPFKKFDEMFAQYGNSVDIFALEIHAEATSEKIACGWHADGKASLIVGSHTHVQTADDCILPHGTAYITDLGMCGAHRSVIGRDISSVLESFIDGTRCKLAIAEEDLRLNGCIVDFDPTTKHPKKISRFVHLA